METAGHVKKKRGVWIPVVTAIMRKNGKVLLGVRPPGESLSGAWEFPGGKIDQGETPEQALRRELQEEIGVDAEIGKLRIVHTHSFGERGVLLLFYDVHFWKGEPKPIYHSELDWIDPTRITQLNIPDANRQIITKLLDVIKDPQI